MTGVLFALVGAFLPRWWWAAVVALAAPGLGLALAAYEGRELPFGAAALGLVLSWALATLWGLGGYWLRNRVTRSRV